MKPRRPVTMLIALPPGHADRLARHRERKDRPRGFTPDERAAIEAAVRRGKVARISLVSGEEAP